MRIHSKSIREHLKLEWSGQLTFRMLRHPAPGHPRAPGTGHPHVVLEWECSLLNEHPHIN